MERVEIKNISLPEFVRKVEDMDFLRWYHSSDDNLGVVILKYVSYGK